MDIQFEKSLSKNQITQAIQNSYEMWGEEKAISDIVSSIEQRRSHYKPTIFEMAGCIDSNNQVISSLKRYNLEYRYNGRICKVIGLGAIYTHPSFRGRGIAQNLIDQVLTEAKNQEFDYALLFSDIGTKYYSRMGFKDYPAEFFRTVSDNIAIEPHSFRFEESSDLKNLKNASNDSYIDDSLFLSHFSNKQFSMLFEQNNFSKILQIYKDEKFLSLVALRYLKNSDILEASVLSIENDHWKLVMNALKIYAKNHNFEEVEYWYLPQNLNRQSSKHGVRESEIPMIKALNPSKAPLPNRVRFNLFDHF